MTPLRDDAVDVLDSLSKGLVNSFAAHMAFSFITFFHILLVAFL
jgi:hypothetical protein